MPKETLCRIVLLEEYVDDGPILVTQLQWYGLDPYTNVSEPKWHVEKMAKTCAPYVRQLEQNFVLERTDRYQLVLSTIKQLRLNFILPFIMC
uniref:Uncharacterized protein n=1 Tax=Acrobeloides nanus TaxID=290746 RepID=A0A914DTX7_9BILA